MYNLSICAGDIWPGTHNVDLGEKYFPGLTWKVYHDSFRVLDNNPSAPDDDLPFFHVWTKLCIKRFGEMPTNESTVDHGRAWRWDLAGSRFRTMHRSFTQRGYTPNCTDGERISVRIDSDGKICATQGNKRIALLTCYGKEDQKLHVLVKPPHGSWNTFKKDEVYPPGKNEIYQPLDHPDLIAWNKKVAQPCVERWAMIEPHLPSAGKGIDLGCHTGWFCRKLAGCGWEMRGVDSSAAEIRMATIMENWSPRSIDRGIRYHHGNVAEYLEKTDHQYDVCLCLSAIMHFFRNEPAKVYPFLAKVSKLSPLLFMDCGWGAYQKNLPFTQSSIGPDIIKHTRYKSFSRLGTTKRENRPFYLFKR